MEQRWKFIMDDKIFKFDLIHFLESWLGIMDKFMSFIKVLSQESSWLNRNAMPILNTRFL